MAVKRQSEGACRKRLHPAGVRLCGGVRRGHQWGERGAGGEVRIAGCFEKSRNT